MAVVGFAILLAVVTVAQMNSRYGYTSALIEEAESECVRLQNAIKNPDPIEFCHKTKLSDFRSNKWWQWDIFGQAILIALRVGATTYVLLFGLVWLGRWVWRGRTVA